MPHFIYRKIVGPKSDVAEEDDGAGSDTDTDGEKAPKKKVKGVTNGLQKRTKSARNR
jgi:hypothetical protein